MPNTTASLSIGSVLDRYKGFGPGFDFLRVALALAILAWHCLNVVFGDMSGVMATPWWIGEYTLVPMFFALSGFLVAASGMRLSLRNFLINRGLRIVPALAVEIFFSALLIGPLFTLLPLGDYFRSAGFWHYFTNIVGVINFYLPGVFTEHPWNQVNGALWTVPYEVACYVVLSALMVTRWLRSPRLVGFWAFGLIIAAVVARAIPGMESTFDNHGSTLFDKAVRFLFTGEQARLLPSFLMGVLAYQLRAAIPYNRKLLAASVAVVIATAVFGNAHLMDKALLRLPVLPAITYIIVFIGVSPMPKLPLYSRGDYSYGIYLYHIPFQQMIWSLLPGINVLALFLLSAPLATLVAMLSWHVIEKPILRLRRRFSFVARERGAVDPPQRAASGPLPLGTLPDGRARQD